MSANADNEESSPVADHRTDATPEGDAENFRPLPRRSPETAARRSTLMAAAAAAGQDRAAAERAAAARRAKLAATAGLPAVLIAATTVALLPTFGTANAATGNACPAGQTPSPIAAQAVAPHAAAATGKGTAKTAKPAKAAGPAAKAHSTAKTGPAPTPVPEPSSDPAKPTVPSASPTATAPAPTTSTSTAPGLLGGLGGLVSSIFNPAPAAKPDVVNKLAASTSPSGEPSTTLAPSSSAPSQPDPTPSSPAPSTKPSAPDSAPSSQPSSAPTSAAGSASAPASTPSSAPTSVCVTPMAAKATRETLWHLDADVLTLYGMTYNGVDTIDTADGPVNVLDFTADTVQLVSMVTYADNPSAPGKLMYADGGKGQTVTLTNVHLHVLKQTGDAFGLLGLTLAPGSPDMTLIGLTEGLKLPIPVVFTGVHVDQYLLTSDTLDVPGFHAYGQS